MAWTKKKLDKVDKAIKKCYTKIKLPYFLKNCIAFEFYYGKNNPNTLHIVKAILRGTKSDKYFVLKNDTYPFRKRQDGQYVPYYESKIEKYPLYSFKEAMIFLATLTEYYSRKLTKKEITYLFNLSINEKSAAESEKQELRNIRDMVIKGKYPEANKAMLSLDTYTREGIDDRLWELVME